MKRNEVDMETADKILQNVFATCEKTPNKTPIEKIEERAKKNLTAEYPLIISTAVLLLFTILAPLFFPHSDVFMSVGQDSVRPLTIVDHSLENDVLSITLEGNRIDIDRSYMEADDGTVKGILKYDSASNTVDLDYDGREYNIYLYDVNGKCLHLLLAPHKN